jgi:hypothetical protein
MQRAVQHTREPGHPENADPAVLRDLERWMGDLAPESRPGSTTPRPDDMLACPSSRDPSSETIPVGGGRCCSNLASLYPGNTAPGRTPGGSSCTWQEAER